MKNMPFLAILALFAASLYISCADNTDGTSAQNQAMNREQSIPEYYVEKDDSFIWDSIDDREALSQAGYTNPLHKGKTIRYTLSWLPNREKGVNSPGGGYLIYYSTKKNFPTEKAMMQRVPYSSGDLAPTEAVLTLSPGTWYVKVAGYSRFNGGTEGTPSDEITVHAAEEE